MRISIFMGPWLPVPAIMGGSIHRLWGDLAYEFHTKGNNVTVFCRSYKDQPKYEVIRGVNYVRRKGFSQSRLIFWNLILDFIYGFFFVMILPRADILVVNDFWMPFFAYLLRRDAGRIVVNVNRFPKGQHRFYSKKVYLAVVSNAIKEAIVRENPKLIPSIKLIPNSIDIKIFSAANFIRKEKLQKIILYIGRIHTEKGLDLLIDASQIVMKNISDIKLRIVGPAEESQGGSGKRYLHSLCIKAKELNVEFCEPIFDLNKLADTYREANIFCYPTLAEKGEAFPVAPIEAMATGLIPVVSNLECFKDFIEDGKTGYIFEHRGPERVKNLARTLESAIADSERNQQISLNAIKKASEFSHEKISNLYLSFFEEILNKAK